MTPLFFESYAGRLGDVLQNFEWSRVLFLAQALRDAWCNGSQVFLCGNGGSAANAMHIANDLLYGIAKEDVGIQVSALPSNASIMTCLANDLGYDEVFARQIRVRGKPNDVLIVLSGSGNSPNVVKALRQAKSIGMQTFAILGYSGGKCLEIADHSIHCEVHDMQICEDVQLVVGHMVTQWLVAHPVRRG